LKLRSDKKLGHLSFLLCWFLLPLPFIFLLLYIEDYFFAIGKFSLRRLRIHSDLSRDLVSLRDAVKAKGTRGVVVARWAVACVGLMSIVQIGLHVPDRREDLRAPGSPETKRQRGDVVIAPD